MRYLLLFLIAVGGLACTSSSPEPETYDRAVTSEVIEPAPGVHPEPAVMGDADIAFTGMDDFPDLVQGCSCALTLDTGEEDSTSTYVFVNNMEAGPGVLGINGKALRVEFILEDNPPETENAIVFVHENDTYRVETELQDEGPSGDEVRMYSGTIKVVEKATGKYKMGRVFGDCGC